MASRRNGKDKSAIADDPSPTQRTALGGSKAIVMMLSHRLGREDLRDEGCCDEGVLVLRQVLNNASHTQSVGRGFVRERVCVRGGRSHFGTETARARYLPRRFRP